VQDVCAKIVNYCSFIKRTSVWGDKRDFGISPDRLLQCYFASRWTLWWNRFYAQRTFLCDFI